MANIKFIEEANKSGQKELAKGILSGVHCFYTKVQQPEAVYSEKDNPRPEMFEYKVDLVVNEDIADQWDEKFAKQPAKKHLKEAFMKKYKLEKDEDFPEGLDPSAKKFWTITLRQNKNYRDKKTGEVKDLSMALRPKVVEMVDNKPVDITMKKLVGNGSQADVLFRVNHSKQYGPAAKLAVVKVTHLIEYEAAGTKDEVLDDFLGGDLEIDESEYEVKSQKVAETHQEDDDFSEMPDAFVPEEDEEDY
jgi:hypothetical protein